MKFTARLTGGHVVTVIAETEEEAEIAIAEQYPGIPGCPKPEIEEFTNVEPEPEPEPEPELKDSKECRENPLPTYGRAIGRLGKNHRKGPMKPFSQIGGGMSWIVLQEALAAIKAGYKVVYVTLEMTPEDAKRRLSQPRHGLQPCSFNYPPFRSIKKDILRVIEAET